MFQELRVSDILLHPSRDRIWRMREYQSIVPSESVVKEVKIVFKGRDELSARAIDRCEAAVQGFWYVKSYGRSYVYDRLGENVVLNALFTKGYVRFQVPGFSQSEDAISMN